MESTLDFQTSERLTCLAERGASRLPRDPPLPCTFIASRLEPSPRPAGPMGVPVPSLSAISSSLQHSGPWYNAWSRPQTDLNMYFGPFIWPHQVHRHRLVSLLQ